VLVPALAAYHEAHRRSLEALGRDSAGLICHVAFETACVLTRMPEGLRVAPVTVLAALEHDFPEPWLALDAAGQRSCLHRSMAAGLRGGTLYDALIAATASEHGATLLTADHRARHAYQAMGTKVAYVEP